MKINAKTIADIYEVIFRMVGKTLEYSNSKESWHLKTAKLHYKCPEQPEKEETGGALSYAWSIASHMNVFRLLQIGKIFKITHKGIADKGVANNKVKSTLLIIHAAGFVSDYLLEPEDILGNKLGKLVHYAPEFLVAPAVSAYKMYNGQGISATIQHLAIKLLPAIPFFQKELAEDNYYDTYQSICNSMSSAENTITDDNNAKIEIHNVETLEITGDNSIGGIAEKEDL